MELTFAGRGAGFNPAEGSTSAYFFDGKAMFLIDCGESVFRTLLEKAALDRAAELYIFITHTHSDHTGSLGSLVLYASIVKKIPVSIIVDGDADFTAHIRALCGIFGLTGRMYRLLDISVFDHARSVFTTARYIKTEHCDELASRGILFETEQGLLFYSGDMRNPAPLLEIINSGRRIDKLYIDSNNDREPNIHHMSIHRLYDIVPPLLRRSIYCMHLNNRQCAVEAEAYGFNVVSCRPR
jgi:ribonuclease BN (tRNA processing enzyme)